MTETVNCGRCGARIDAESARSGTCPACLMELALEEDTAATPPDVHGNPGRTPVEGDPETVGPYRIVRRLGEGGMGVVHLAEQSRPIRRRVALKVIKRGMDTRQVIARFETERQTLARMDHPAIARVFEAGSTDRGRPYFAMELVDGEPITEWCDRQRLGIAARLELFIQVCDGIQHAHQKGIIHRDIKPSNVLVAGSPERPSPKIIDFGVARAVEQRLTEQTLFTELGVLVGTPEYMSPEQAALSPLGVDTRTDVYSLGVLLYELLVGALPFDPAELRAHGFDEVRRRIREDDPPTPTDRLRTLGKASSDSARRRGLDPPALRRTLSGDLDWITLRALEKDRARRYGSPAELAADLRRHLDDEPVLARPPNASYRVGKFVRRHKLLVGSLAGVFAAVVAGAVLATVFALREAEQRRTADRAREDLERVVAFQAGMLADIRPDEVGRRLVEDLRTRAVGAVDEGDSAAFGEVLDEINATDVALRVIDEEILGRAAETLAEEFAAEALIEARLRHTIAETYGRLGLYERADEHARLAVEIRERELGEEHADTLAAITARAKLQGQMGRYEDAERMGRRSLEIARRALGEKHPETARAANSLGITLWQLGRYDEAGPLLSAALGVWEDAFGPDYPDAIFARNNLAILYYLQGRHDEAERLYLETLERCRRVFGSDHFRTLAAMNNLGALYMDRTRYEKAERLFIELRALQREALGDEHPDALRSGYNLGNLYSQQGRLEEAEALYVETLDKQRRALGPGHADTIWTMNSLAGVYRARGQYREAESRYLEVRELIARALGEEHPFRLHPEWSLGGLYLETGRLDEAEETARAVLEGRRAVMGDTHTDTLAARYLLARVLAAQGRVDAAERLFLEVVETSEEVLGEDSPATLESMRSLVDLYVDRGEPERARPLAETLMARRRVAATKEGAGVPARHAYARALLTLEPRDIRDPARALPIAREVAESASPPNPDYLDTLALARFANGDAAGAVEIERRAIALLSRDDRLRLERFSEHLRRYSAQASD